MIVKYDPRKELCNMFKQLITVDLVQERRGVVYQIKNLKTNTIYGTLMKKAPTEWEIEIFKFALDKKTLTIKPIVKYSDYGCHDILEVDEDPNPAYVTGLLPMLAKLVNKENLLQDRKNKIIDLFEKTFG